MTQAEQLNGTIERVVFHSVAEHPGLRCSCSKFLMQIAPR